MGHTPRGADADITDLLAAFNKELCMVRYDITSYTRHFPRPAQPIRSHHVEAQLNRFQEDENLIQRHNYGTPSRSLFRGIVFYPIFVIPRPSFGSVHEAHGDNTRG